jgi:hypothetical protein
MITKIKLILSIIVWGLYGLLYSVFYPVLTNEAALKQLEDSNNSFINYAFYRQIWNGTGIILIFITIIIFSKELKGFIIRGGKNNV